MHMKTGEFLMKQVYGKAKFKLNKFDNSNDAKMVATLSNCRYN
jgi:hypothetical protein